MAQTEAVRARSQRSLPRVLIVVVILLVAGRITWHVLGPAEQPDHRNELERVMRPIR